MQKADPLLRRWALIAAVTGLLYLIYLLTFSGAIQSDDELILIDTVESVALRGSILLNQTAHLRPVQPSDVEPGQPLAALPLFWIAYRIPWLSNLHAVLLLNLIVTALTAAVVLLYALHLGYSQRTALIATLLFGLTTIAWPYTQTFFREPLAGLSAFAAAFLLHRWRDGLAAENRRRTGLLIGGIALATLSVLTKESGLLMLPFLALIAFPESEAVSRHKRVILIGVTAVLVLAILLGAAIIVLRDATGIFVTRYVVLVRLEAAISGLPKIVPGLAGFLLSPGKSIWMYSPILLLALASPALLPRSRWRESWLPLAMLIFMAIVYAAVRQEVWFGGAGWGPRYLVPLTPFLMIGVLPALDRILNSRSPLLIGGLAALSLFGLALQVAATWVYLHDYYAYQGAMTGLPSWDPAILWGLRWTQAIGTLLYMPLARPGIVWLLPGRPDWPMIGALAAAVLLLATLLILIARRGEPPRHLLLAACASPALAMILTGVGLARAYDDPRYLGDFPEMLQMIRDLSRETPPDDVILLASDKFILSFVSYYKGQAVWYSLPYAPGYRPNPDVQPAVISEDVDELIGAEAAALVDNVIGKSLYTGHPIWLVEDGSSYLEWAVRPVERYLAWYTYPVDERYYAPTARVVRFLPMYVYHGTPALNPVGADFGGLLRLNGYDAFTPGPPNELSLRGHLETAGGAIIPNDQVDVTGSVQPGSQIGFSLEWEVLAPIERDYIMALYLISPEGAVFLQQDREPVYGFEHTSRWLPGQVRRDNFGFVLPADTPPGDYQVWAVVYSWPEMERLPITASDEGTAGPDYVVLTTLSVQP
ncbi:MAG: hypothetical protein Kow00124_13580 [Anaerolineae bacterium]